MEYTVINGISAVKLWLRMKDDWNSWVDEHPNASIDFGGINFSNYRDECSNKEVIFFDKYIFPKGFNSFQFTVFGNMDSSFQNTLFNGLADFSNSDFGKGEVNFENAVFMEDVSFKEIKSTEFIIRFNLRYASFHRNLILPNSKFNCVPDLRDTKITNQITLHGTQCKLHRERGPLWGTKRATDPEDASRLRRLKEIAENNKDHERSLAFHADEMRARRWHELSKVASILDMIFSGLCDYGRSIFRPSGMFLLFNSLLAMLYACPFPGNGEKLLKGYELAFANALPFLPTSHTLREKNIEFLFQTDIPAWLGTVTTVQGVISFIFLFLIGLGLRNRFRI
jgi:hypothetical protein